MSKKNYFIKNSKLTEQQKKFCRCILHIAKANKSSCNRTKKWNNKIKCYNPYSTCAKSVKTTTGGKPCNYNFKNLSKKEIITYIKLNYKKFKYWLYINKIKKYISKMNVKELKKYVTKWYDTYKK